MTTWAWTYGLALTDPKWSHKISAETFEYLSALVGQLTHKQALYAEIQWSDPI
uniref:Uncharacterized protein n=1 Tax=viral metagenome TaxID=1070528 RepID=A0A6M3KAH5_9ZZZZ